MRLHLCISLIMGLSTSLLSNVKAFAANFQFTEITKISNISAAPAINNQGTVAFSGVLPGGTQGIFISNGQTINTIAKVDQRFSKFSDFSLNDAGTVAFAAQLNDGVTVETANVPVVIVPGNGIFIGNGSTTKTISVIPRGEAYAGFSKLLLSPSINNAGTVVYLKYDRPATFIETSDRKNIGIGGFPNFREPVINDAGAIAYIDPNTVSIVVNDGTTDKIFARPSDAINLEGLSFNNQGVAAFSTVNYGVNGYPFGSKLLTSDGIKQTTIADTNGSFSNLFSSSINDQGTVVFAATLDDGGSGIFTGSNPNKDKVIATGDELLGSQVTNISFSREGLNNAGQITFFATLANGTGGIFRADPTLKQSQPIPEPSNTLAILTFAILGVASTWKQLLIKVLIFLRK